MPVMDKHRDPRWDPNIMRTFTKILHRQRFKFLISTPLKVALMYFAVGVLWIRYSDRFLLMLTDDLNLLSYLQTIKGWFYVLITAAMLYLLILRDFKALQNSQCELQMSYEATLEGWVRALDLRDNATEVHTRRVTDLTVTLARRMGVEAKHLEFIRRGALLHDIGKMGVPDQILQKEGALTPAEWEIMRRHPTYACDFLTPVAYLESSLDIPCYHHEKWDGSGYPKGLAGQEIPLSARIFAVVDVWDALISDRPYRKAWSEEAALKYIREQAGSHFDPAVVNCFLEIMGQQNSNGHEGRRKAKLHEHRQ